MGHSHAHGHTELDLGPPRPRLAWALGLSVVTIAIASVIGMFLLYPDSADRVNADGPHSADGVTIIDGEISAVEYFACDGFELDGVPEHAGDCAEVFADTEEDGEVSFLMDATQLREGIESGDQVRIVKHVIPAFGELPEFAEGEFPDPNFTDPNAPGADPAADQEISYMFHEHQRGGPIVLLAIAFAVLVIAVARWRGVFAIAGVAVTVAALVSFVLPAILAGVNPLAVAIVGSSAIMIAVLYLAHGISIRTTSALYGTLIGLALTALLGAWATGATKLTGLGSEDGMVLAAIAPELRLSSVVMASMVIAGLGVLNDVTVTQASAVWELRGLQPRASRAALFLSAMRIGRDHIASSVYTLVFAYAGSAMTILLLISAYDASFWEMATTEELGQEIVRILVGAIGLVLAVPGTTAIAAALAPPPVSRAGARSAEVDTLQ